MVLLKLYVLFGDIIHPSSVREGFNLLGYILCTVAAICDILFIIKVVRLQHIKDESTHFSDESLVNFTGSKLRIMLANLLIKLINAVAWGCYIGNLQVSVDITCVLLLDLFIGGFLILYVQRATKLKDDADMNLVLRAYQKAQLTKKIELISSFETKITNKDADALFNIVSEKMSSKEIEMEVELIPKLVDELKKAEKIELQQDMYCYTFAKIMERENSQDIIHQLQISCGLIFLLQAFLISIWAYSSN